MMSATVMKVVMGAAYYASVIGPTGDLYPCGTRGYKGAGLQVVAVQGDKLPVGS